MRLVLRLIEAPAPGAQVADAVPGELVLTEQGGSLGRGRDADCRLPDASRTVSNQHALISFSRDHGAFYITDTSTNGTFINGAPQPVGRGNSAWLSANDRIQIGDYSLSVILQPDREPPPPAAACQPSSPDPRQTQQAAYQAASSAPVGQPASAPAPGSGAAIIPDDWDFSDLAPATAPTQQNAPAPAPPAQPAALDSMMPGGSASAAAAQDAPAAAGADDLVAFWQGLGMELPAMQPYEREEAMRRLGAALRHLSDGLVQLYAARRSVKREFRLDQTQLAALENNPFKFLESGAEALRVSLSGQSGFRPTDEAVAEAFADITAHELSTVAGMQAAQEALLQALAPEALSPEAAQGKAKGAGWDRFTERWGELRSDGPKGAQALLAAAFARAYEQQAERSRS